MRVSGDDRQDHYKDQAGDSDPAKDDACHGHAAPAFSASRAVNLPLRHVAEHESED
jgi:hypothetical protein